MPSALIIGCDPHAVTGMDGDAMRAVLDQAIAFNTSGADSLKAAQQ
jgi:hypothetical protein